MSLIKTLFTESIHKPRENNICWRAGAYLNPVIRTRLPLRNLWAMPEGLKNFTELLS